MSGRRICTAIVVTAAVCTAAAAALAATRDRTDAVNSIELAQSAAPSRYATIEQRDLARTVKLSGAVDHGARRDLPLAATGTITGLPAAGDVIDATGRLVEIDGRPVIVMPGDRPAWRSLEPGITKGEDIAHLESLLVWYGYATADELTVDDTWTAATTKAVKAFQQATGMAEDGRLELGEIVFVPLSLLPLRIDKVDATMGAPASSARLSVTDTELVATATLPAASAALLDVGDSVSIELPTGERRDGVVSAIGAPAAGDDGKATFPVTIDAAGLRAAEGLPVNVHVAVVAAADATVVPADALLALASGGYAVEVPIGRAGSSESPGVEPATGTRLVPVDVGVFADGWVQITGDVAVGEQVVIP